MQTKHRGLLGLLLVLAAGLAAAFLRTVEFRKAWDKQLMLFDNASPFAEILFVFTVLVVLALAFWLYRRFDPSKQPDETGAAESAPRRFPVIASVFAALSVLLMLASGLFDFVDSVGASNWPYLVFSLLTFLATAAVAATSRDIARGTVHRRTHGLYLLAPVLWGTFWLILTFRETPTLPVVTLYMFDAIAIAFFMLTVLFEAGTYFDRAKPARTLFCALAGLFFTLLAAVSQGLYRVLEGQWIDVVPSVGHCLRFLFLVLFLSYMVIDLLGRHYKCEEKGH